MVIRPMTLQIFGALPQPPICVSSMFGVCFLPLLFPFLNKEENPLPIYVTRWREREKKKEKLETHQIVKTGYLMCFPFVSLPPVLFCFSPLSPRRRLLLLLPLDFFFHYLCFKFIITKNCKLELSEFIKKNTGRRDLRSFFTLPLITKDKKGILCFFS